MVSLKVLVPDATINYVTNPSLRYDTTGWNAQGSTSTRVLTQARFGVASLQVVTAGSAQREGAYFRVSSLSGVSEAITVSAYVRGTGKVRIRLDNNVIGGAEYPSQPVVLKSDRWQRIQITGFSTGGNDLRLYVETDEGIAVARTFYVDGAQLERKVEATTYCDGDQEGCRWNGLYHGSTSLRNTDTRSGGKWIELAGTEREQEDLYMTVAGGLGAAPLQNQIQSFALAPGGYFQNNKIGMRPITLTFHAKHKVDDRDEPVSLAYLHQLRQTLIDLVKPDLTGGDEDICFEYTDGTIPLYFKARYDGGLEGEWDIRNQFINSFPLRLLATNPIMAEDNQNAVSLDIQDTLSVNKVAARINGRWTNLNYGFNDDVVGLAWGPRGQLYAIGQDTGFTTANNNAAAIDPLRPVRAISYFDGEKWNAIGPIIAISGGVSPGLIDVAVAINGDVFVTGSFTSIGGVAANYIARWDGSAWNALGTGLNALGSVLAIAPNGDVYVGGSFTTAGGLSCLRVARWDGSSWHRLGTYGGLNGAVSSMAISKDGTLLYVGGSFTDENGNPGTGTTRTAIYNIELGTFAAMGSGLDASVEVLKISPTGILYAGGNFANSGSDEMNHIAMWNESTWLSMGSGLCFYFTPLSPCQGVVRDIDFFSNGNVVAVGEFNDAGGTVVNNVAVWNGTTWFNLDTQANFVASVDSIYACRVHPKTDDLYLAWFTATVTAMKTSGITVVNNTGSLTTSPRIYVRGPGTVRWIENQNTKKIIYLDLALLNNEEVLFDFGLGTIESTLRGNLVYSLIPGSDFRAFGLAPGNNTLAFFMTNDVNAVAQIYYTPQHWSVDATQRMV